MGSRRPAGVFWTIGVAAVGAAAVIVLLAATSPDLPQRTLRAAMLLWVSLPPVFAGIVAWNRRPDSRFGPLLIASGFAATLSALQWSEQSGLHTVGRLADLLVAAVWLHVFLAYPSGRLVRRPEKVIVTAGYIAALGLQLAVLMLGDFGTGQPLAVTENLRLAELIQDTQLLSLSGLLIAGAVLLVVRRIRAGRGGRRPVTLVIDSFGLALVMTAALLLAGTFALPGFQQIQLATFFVVGVAPVAFLAGLLDAHLARASVADMLVDLRSYPAQAGLDLQTPIARVLRDPSVELAFWLPQYGTWADQDGSPAMLPEPAAGRAVTMIEQDGDLVAALVCDAALEEEPELIAAVTAAAGMALSNARLQAELRARLQELHSSRGRVIEAEQKERQRLERDLHDGAQQRLVALALELGRLGEQVSTDREARLRLDSARHEVTTALEELRDLARGIHPAVLSDHGLPVALESVADRSGLPVRLKVEDCGRLPEPIEVAAYYVVCESLANVAKHAWATSTEVEVALDRGTLVVEVTDDGVGGADSERGTGLRGLADRVEALDGRLRIWTPAGGGTRVRAEIPCG